MASTATAERGECVLGGCVVEGGEPDLGCPACGERFQSADLARTVPLLEYLREFNRKERFFLVGWALSNPGFALGDTFRSELQQQLGLDVEIPGDAFVAMDYHLEWLYASLILAANGGDRGPHPNPPCVAVIDSDPTAVVPLILGNQEDIDLFIAFEAEEKTYLLLIEAKGATGFTNNQLTSKVRRLTAMFADPQVACLPLDPRFVIASPREPQGIVTAGWQNWMLREGKPWWIRMPFPTQALMVTRCDAQGNPSALGTNWTVVDVRYEPSDRGKARAAPVGMSRPFNSISEVAIGQQVTYVSTVTGAVQIGTARRIDPEQNRVLVRRPNGSSGWMLLQTIGRRTSV